MRLQMNRVVQTAVREMLPRATCGNDLGGRQEFLARLTFE